MSISFAIRSTSRAANEWTFSDDVTRITIGRRPDCDIKFDDLETHVGRLHCVIRQSAGDYRLELNRRNAVFLEEKRALNEVLLADGARLRLGHNGPELVVSLSQEATLPRTIRGESLPGGTINDPMGPSIRKVRSIVIGTFLLAVAITGVVYQLRDKVDEVGSRQQQLEISIVNLADRTHEQKASLSRMHTKFTKEFQDIEGQEQEFLDRLNMLKESVCLVLKQDEGKHYEPQATAWVIDQSKGVVATNAHVADIFLHELLEGQRLLIRTSGTSPQDFLIESVQIHPGYEVFSKLWKTYDPVQRTARGQMNTVQPPGNACDVALMRVLDPSRLPAALSLASTDVLYSLRPGEQLAYIGFPMEGIGLINIENPQPTTHLRYVTSATSYFGDDDVDESERLLVLHALPSTGGSSGSPILNRQGQVVAVLSGGNTIGQTWSARIVSSASIFFSQRADLVRELLDGTADAIQSARTQHWNEDIKLYFSRRSEERIDIVNNTLTEWTQTLENEGDYSVSLHKINETPIQFDPSNEGSYELTVQLQEPGFHHVGILCESNSTYSSFSVKHTETGERGLELIVGASAIVEGRMESMPFTTSDAGILNLQMETGDFETKATLYVHNAERQLRSVGERIRNRLDIWEELLDEIVTFEGQLEPLLHRELTLESGEAVADLQLDQPGHYLIMAISPQGHDIDMVVSRKGDETRDVLSRDTRVSSLAFASLKLDEPQVLQLDIVGPSERIESELFVYHVPQR